LKIRFRNKSIKKHINWPGSYWSESTSIIILSFILLTILLSTPVSVLIIRHIYLRSDIITSIIWIVFTFPIIFIISMFFILLLFGLIMLIKNTFRIEKYQIEKVINYHENNKKKITRIYKDNNPNSNILYEYKYDLNGNIVYQKRNNGKMILRLFGEIIGLNAENISYEEYCRSGNRYWNPSLLTGIPELVASSNLYILGFAYPDVPKPVFDYTIFLCINNGTVLTSNVSNFIQTTLKNFNPIWWENNFQTKNEIFNNSHKIIYRIETQSENLFYKIIINSSSNEDKVSYEQ